MKKTRRKSLFTPSQIIVCGFLAVLLLGAILLSLPCAVKDGAAPVPFLDALFTSTSSVCVTGLIVTNTGLTFSLFGQIVILCLIQIGGLGFMTVASLVFLILGKQITLRERLLIRESFSEDTLQGLSRLVWNALLVTLIVETIGAAVLTFRFVPEYGVKGIYYAVFLAVSGFCNAGFDPFGFSDSLITYRTDPVISITLALLIVLGGLGFAVITDLIRYPSKKRLSLHSRVVIFVTLGLLLVGTVLFAVAEWTNPQTLGDPSLSDGQRILMAFFDSATLRTAGFDTVGQGNLTPAGTLISLILMFIGASPASTGGGIKTTTFFIVWLTVFSVIRQKEDVTAGKRRIPTPLIKKAFAIFLLALALVLLDTVAISLIQTIGGTPFSLPDILFEVVSAGATVGLSTGITASLLPLSKFFIILTMFAGRVGMLTFTIALSGDRGKQNAIRYPEERLMIG